MSMLETQLDENNDDLLGMVEQCLTTADWVSERVDDVTLNCASATRWGECGGMFVFREEPRSLHFSLSVDMRAAHMRRQAITEILALVNERLWIGHFEHWAEEGVLMFRHTLPLLGRTTPEPGEIAAVLTGATEAVEHFLPAFNFVVWAGKSPKEAIKSALFETIGEA